MALTIILACLGSSGLFELIKLILERMGRKHDRLDDLIESQRAIIIDRVTWLGKQHITAGHISLAQKENLERMYRAAKKLGMNGDLEVIMEEVRHLEVMA